MQVVVVQCRGKTRSFELWIVPRTRDGAHVDHAPNAVSFQQTDKLLDGPCRMSDGKDDQRVGTIHRPGLRVRDSTLARDGLRYSPRVRAESSPPIEWLRSNPEPQPGKSRQDVPSFRRRVHP